MPPAMSRRLTVINLLSSSNLGATGSFPDPAPPSILKTTYLPSSRMIIFSLRISVITPPEIGFSDLVDLLCLKLLVFNNGQSILLVADHCAQERKFPVNLVKAPELQHPLALEQRFRECPTDFRLPIPLKAITEGFLALFHLARRSRAPRSGSPTSPGFVRAVS